MNNKDILFTKEYFKYYCDKNKKFYDKINKLDDGNYIFDVSSTSLERYEPFNSYLIDNNLLNKKSILLDFGCYIGFYIHFLHNIGVLNSYGIDLSYKSIQFGKKIGIHNLFVGDITCLGNNNFKNNSVNYISCMHVFEYSYVIKNGDLFIYNTLSEGFRLLKKGGKFFFSIGEGYQEYNKKLKKYIHLEGKIDLDKQKIMEIGFSKLEALEGGYYIITK